MNSFEVSTVRDLLDRALDVPAQERGAFLDSACGGNVPLRHEVNSLLRALVAADEFLERSPIEQVVVPLGGAGLSAGTRVAGFTIIRRIAAGGMGVVYEAMQDSPRRTVALKVMKSGLASLGAARRFDQEATILARLRHPNIGQIYEAGIYDEGAGGTPWFAMEFIPEARPLTEYARERQLNLAARLELFLKVCDAVHYGHQKGVIHRDLKPANILIDSSASDAGLGEPKVIDFGVARAAGADFAPTTLHTQPGQLIGTIQYMSPEQCSGDAHGVDTRSDVYSLGVVLYELLSGRAPYDVAGAPIVQAMRTIVEAPPSRLSSVDQALRGDIETIVLKALEKEPARRYQSAADLAGDIRRFLRREPIVARPVSAMYQVRLLAKRHPGVFYALSALFVVLIGGIIATSILWVQAESARERSEQMTARSIQSFRTQLDAAVKLAERVGSAAVAREFVEELTPAIETDWKDYPELEAPLRIAIADNYRYLSLFSEAEMQAQAAVRAAEARRHADPGALVAATFILADVMRDQTRHGEAEKLYRKGMALESQVTPPREWDYGSHDSLADMLCDVGRFEDSEEIYLGIVAWFREFRDKELYEDSYFARGIARVYRCQGRYAEAELLLQRALNHRESFHFDDPGWELAEIEREMGELYLSQGRLEEALDCQECALAFFQRTRTFETDHAGALRTLALGAEIGLTDGRFVEAEAGFDDAATRAEKFLRSEQKWWAANFRTGQAICLLRLLRYEEADPMLLNAYAVLHERLGDPHHRTQTCIRAVIELLEATNRADEAEPWREKLRPASVNS